MGEQKKVGDRLGNIYRLPPSLRKELKLDKMRSDPSDRYFQILDETVKRMNGEVHGKT